ncbi:MAG: YlxR family protein [Lachnospiraceae bacterium]|nr:YlxR family protein [Lachnospiraceae bacterium]
MREPERQCTACRIRRPKRELIRLVRDPEGEVIIDIRQRADGRGTYICRSEECIELARKRRGIDRSLICRTTDDLYDRLKGIIYEQT